MLSEEILNKLALEVANNVKGDWLIFGGSALYLIGINTRATIDVDIAPFDVSTNKDSLQLMKIAEDLRLPIETINQAGAFFLNRISNWQARTRLYKKGKIGSIHIPDIELYIELKSERLSESDLLDCISYLNWTQAKKIKFDKGYIQQILRRSQVSSNSEKRTRIKELMKHIT